MSEFSHAGAGADHGRKAASVPTHRALSSLMRDPLKALVDFGDQAGGEVIRLNLGSFRPYLVTSPAHVQHILRDNAANYTRDGKGMLWRPVKRLFGEGILAEGQVWSASRKALQPLFTAKRVQSLGDRLADAVGAAVDEWDEPAQSGQPIDACDELSKVVCRAIMRVLFADKISVTDALRVVEAQDIIATAIMPRLFVPFVPNVIPMPGDRAFNRAVQRIDEVLLPVVREARRQRDEGDDIISTLSRAKDSDGREFGERQVRNDVVAMFATSTETTFGVLTWLWPILQAHPEVAQRLYEEIGRVVGADRVRASHLPELRYTKMVLEELVRLFPVGWLMPRTAVDEDVIGGVRINAGASVLISPYVTQRMSTFWDRPDDFDPERFSPEQRHRRHRYAHFPFGGGHHSCLGQHLFYLESQLIVANILSRFRFRLADSAIPKTQVAASLRLRGRVEMTLSPLQRPVAV